MAEFDPTAELPATMPGLDSHLGFQTLEATADRVVLRWTMRPELAQPWGIAHGGVYCSAVESAASIAASVWAGNEVRVVGVSNSTDFYRAIREGTLTAVARPVHRGRSQQVWRVAVTDEQDRLVAEGQVRLQNLAGSDRGAGR